MDATDAPQETKKRRLIYDREAILAIKKNATSSGINIYDALPRTNVSVVSQRGSRSKSKLSGSSKNQGGCLRDSCSIVLGPQKRTWNTGCHVSHPNGREGSEPYGSGSRGGKGGADYRFLDRSHRGAIDYKRDFRGGHVVSRDRGVSRRSDGVSFCRVQSKDDRTIKESRFGLQEEPEWFSEGPTTVNETIELGGMLDEVDDAIDDSVERPNHTASDTAYDGDCKLQKVSSDSNKSSDPISNQPCGSQDGLTASAASISRLDLLNALQIPKSTKPQGSRFKHLFPKSNEETPPIPKGNVNDQLLQLLKGPSGQGPSLADKSGVLQVENKLRSILLGHSGSRTNENHSSVVENKSTKPEVLTVEEIEAQLNCSSNQHSEVNPTDRPGTTANDKTEGAFKSFSSNTTVGSNLAPMLQSLALKQQQQVACAQSVHLRSALNTIGILSNPMVRLPNSANAMSASARINQLQQADLPASSGLGDFNSGHQAVRYMWDNGLGNQIASHQLQSATNSLNPAASRPRGPPPGLLTDLNSRQVFGLTPSNPNATTISRRPIVKVQQSPASTHCYTPLSPLITSNCNSSGVSVSNLSDLDRRFLNFAPKQQVDLNGQRGLSESFVMASAVPSASSNEMYYPPPGLSQNASSTLIDPLSSTNNNAFLGLRARSTLQGDNALTFLSQLVERDRTACPRPSDFGSLLNSSIKAKTLEEIEHQEVTSTGSFL